MAIYQTRPEAVEAFQWTADIYQKEDPAWVRSLIENGNIQFAKSDRGQPLLLVLGNDGVKVASRHDYLVRYPDGRVEPMREGRFLSQFQLLSEEGCSNEVTLTYDEKYRFDLERDVYTWTGEREIHQRFYKIGLNPADPSLMVRHDEKSQTYTYFRGD